MCHLNSKVDFAKEAYLRVSSAHTLLPYHVPQMVFKQSHPSQSLSPLFTSVTQQFLSDPGHKGVTISHPDVCHKTGLLCPYSDAKIQKEGFGSSMRRMEENGFSANPRIAGLQPFLHPLKHLGI